MPARLPSRVARVARAAVPDDGVTQLGIVAPGTAGADAVVEAIVDRLAERDVPVLRVTGRRLEQEDELGAVAHLLVGEPSASGNGAGVAARVRAGRDALVARLDGGAADAPTV